MKRSRAISLFVTAAVALSACATSDNATNSQQAPEVQGCEISNPPAQPVTINYIGWTFPIMDYYASALKKCNDVENLSVNFNVSDSATVGQKARLTLSAGGASSYDIIMTSNPEVAEFGQEGWLLPLDDLIKKYNDQYGLDDINEKAWEGATVDGKVYGIPMDANTLNLAYRSDLFEEYGINVPETYDDVITACKTLKQDSSLDAPFAMDLSAGWAWDLTFFGFIRSFGGDYLNKDGTPAFNSAEGVAAAQKIKDVADACMGSKNLTAYGYESNEVAMNTGAIGFTQIWAANTTSMNNPEKSNYAEEIKFAPAPAPKPGGPLDGESWNDYYTIPTASTADPELVFQIIMSAASQKSQEEASKLGLVTRTSVQTGIPALKAANETIERGVGIYPTVPGMPLAQAALGNWLPFIGSGKYTPKEALDAAAKEYTRNAKKKGAIK